MPTRLTQTEQQPPGTAALQVSGPAGAQLTEPESVEIAIVQPGPTERYLDPRNPDDPWTTSVYRFHPLNPRRQGAALWLEIDYGVSYHLRANQPYKLRLRQAGGVEVEEVFTVPAALRRPTTRPIGWTAPPGPRGPLEVPVQAVEAPVTLGKSAAPVARVPEPVPEPVPVPVSEPSPMPQPLPLPIEPPPAPVAAPPPAAAPAAILPPPSQKKWLVPLALLLVAAGSAAAYFLMPRGTPAVAETMDGCRKMVSAAPEPAAARARAETLAKGGQLLDCQFLLYRYAADKGDRDAARTMGSFYDPDTWSKEKSPLPAPNPAEAVRWHKQAAEAGDAESQYRYGMLLKLGRTDAADGPEQAQAWLRKAAEQGHPQAKDALTQ